MILITKYNNFVKYHETIEGWSITCLFPFFGMNNSIIYINTKKGFSSGFLSLEQDARIDESAILDPEGKTVEITE